MSTATEPAGCCVPGAAACRDDAPTKEDIQALQQGYTDAPESARATFTSASTLTTGLRSTAKIREFEVHADEPKALGGTDTAPNPVELLLASLGACQEITYKAFAQVLGIDLQRVSVTVHGKVDLRGFFAVSDEVRPGFHEISGTVEFDAPGATDEQLDALKAAVDAHCPVLDMLRNPVPVELKRA